MRRFPALLVAVLLVGHASLPAVAAICCPRAQQHACCLEATHDSAGSELKPAPCCRLVALAEAAKADPATPASIHPALALPASVVARVPADAPLAPSAPASFHSPSPPPLGPPLRLRI
jgi:hypothetical protein